MLSPNRVFLPIGKTFLPGVKKPSRKKYSPTLNPGLPGALPSARGRFQTTGPVRQGLLVQTGRALAGAGFGRRERTKKAGKDQRPSRP